MKTPTTFILSLTIIITISAGSAFGAYSGGTGEPNDPYQIADANDLLALAADTNDYGKCFILTADVNLQGQVFTKAIIAMDTVTGGISFFEGTPFTGTFDGNDYKITHFTINGGSNSYLGLFGKIDTGGSVKNLGLENCIVSGSSALSFHSGGLVEKTMAILAIVIRLVLSTVLVLSGGWWEQMAAVSAIAIQRVLSAVMVV